MSPLAREELHLPLGVLAADGALQVIPGQQFQRPQRGF